MGCICHHISVNVTEKVFLYLSSFCLFPRKAMVHQMLMQQFPMQTGFRLNLRAYANGERSKERGWSYLVSTGQRSWKEPASEV